MRINTSWLPKFLGTLALGLTVGHALGQTEDTEQAPTEVAAPPAVVAPSLDPPVPPDPPVPSVAAQKSGKRQRSDFPRYPKDQFDRERAVESEMFNRKWAVDKEWFNRKWAVDKEAFSHKEVIAKSIVDFFAGSQWLFLVVFVLAVLRQQLKQLISTLADRFSSSGVEFQIEPTGTLLIKFDRSPEAPGSLTLSSFASALDLQPDKIASTSIDFGFISEPTTFPVSQTAVEEWAAGAGAGAIRATDAARQALVAAAGNPVSTAADIQTRLIEYLIALEKSRFWDVRNLNELEASPAIAAALQDLEGTPARILWSHAKAIWCTNASNEKWSEGDTELAPFVDVDPISHLAAADVFLCCRFSAFSKRVFEGEQTPDSDKDVNEFLEVFGPLCLRLQDARKTGIWSTAWMETGNSAFYEREFSAALGMILSTIAECVPPTKRDSWLNQAEPLLHLCTQTLGNPPTEELATARDYNNYADLLRQLGRYDEAYEQIKLARERAGNNWDPSFAETRSLILCGLNRKMESLEAIEEYNEHAAVAEGKKDETAQYIKNQLTRARLMFRFMQERRVDGLDEIIRVLEDARKFLRKAEIKALLGVTFATLERSLSEALGDAFLQTIWKVDQAEEAFRDASVHKNMEPVEAGWRRTIALAGGRVRLAHLQRRAFNHGEAEKQRNAAGALLFRTRTIAAELPLTEVGAQRKRKRTLLYLDALEAHLDLAGEYLRQGDSAGAANLADPAIAELWKLVDDSPTRTVLSTGMDGQEACRRLLLVEGRIKYLKGRLLVLTTETIDTAVVESAQEYFSLKQFNDATLSQKADIALGEFLLSASLKGTGDVLSWYERVLQRFEQAIQSNDPDYRREAVRVYASAVAQRERVMKHRRELLAKN